MIHVCYGLYDKFGRYSKFTGTSIISIFENTKFEVTAHILHDNTLTLGNRKNFQAIAEKYNQQIKFHNVEEDYSNELQEFTTELSEINDSPYSIGTLYRFMIMNIFPPEIEKVIYLDADIIVNLDINELWQIELGDSPLAGISEQANGVPPQFLFELCRTGIVKDDQYFNAGVLVLNLNRLRNEQQNIRAGLKFVASNPQCTFFDQDILNYCFAPQALLLPIKFNRLVEYARLAGENVAEQKIYHYVGDSLKLNLRDVFNRLWASYFTKSSWFNLETVLRFYDCIQALHSQSQNKLIELSAAMSGKRRIFFVELDNLEKFKKMFHISKSEEIINSQIPDAMKILLKKMKKLRGNGYFLLFIRQYTEVAKTLTQAGFLEGEDFTDATKLLSQEHGLPLDTYFLIRAI